ncbi:hypothetical protein [Phormidium tenue]|uniref:Uncharacterized protein n=1 Tax=Phormidium tenue FACHB-1050 TaxID=2692857 RepID=A0ABR8CI29_9CYAN|nr:hypothetical protein [Phormidium tenue]MBD2319695.1 hypothetical protein [Phormidium tenue FACHB-1050]
MLKLFKFPVAKVGIEDSQQGLLKALLWYNGSLRPLFGPSPSSMIPLNLMAAAFIHTHTDASMRILHGYTSLGLIPGLFTVILMLLKKIRLKLVITVLAVNAIFLIVNTLVAVSAIDMPYGQVFHALISAIILGNFFLTNWLNKLSAEQPMKESIEK